MGMWRICIVTACLLNNQILTETTIQVIGSLVSQESWQVMPHALKSKQPFLGDAFFTASMLVLGGMVCAGY